MSILEDFSRLITSVETTLGDGDDLTREMVIDHADLIIALSDKCKATELYKRSPGVIASMVRLLETNEEVDDLLTGAWCLLLHSFTEAQTEVRSQVVVALTIPLVARYLPQ